MTSRTPEMRFLGLPGEVDEPTLLGLEQDVPSTPLEITEALERRLELLDRHPGRLDASARTLRLRLNAAASRMMALAGSETPAKAGGAVEVSMPTVRSTGIGITPFDRMILSILVASGGWNAASRGRITGLAAVHSVHPKAMTRIMTGLSQILRDGDLALPSGGFVANADSARRVSEMQESFQNPANRGESSPMVLAAVDQVAARLSREFSGNTPGSRIRILITCGICAIILIALFTLALTVPSPIVTRMEEERVKQEVLEKELRSLTFEDTPSIPFDSVASSRRVKPAQWSTRPSLVGSVDGSGAQVGLKALDWIADFGVLERKASLPDQGSDESLFRTYRSLLFDVGSTWPLLEPKLLDQILKASIKPVSTSVGERRAQRFLDEIVNLGVADPSSAQAPWLLSYSSGLLGMCAGGAEITESLRARAQSLHSASNARRSVSRVQENLFVRSAGFALDGMIPGLLSKLEADREGGSDQIEAWLLAQQALRSGALYEVAILDAVGEILRERVVIEPENQVLDLLARLLGEVEFSSRAYDPFLVKLNLMDWFEHEGISSHNLWLLGSLFLRLGDVAWWNDELVLPFDADQALRSEFADRIEALWPRFSPGERPRGVMIAVDEYDRIERLVTALDGMPAPDDDVDRFHAIRTFAVLILSLEEYESDRRVDALESLRAAEALSQQGYLSTRRSQDLFGESGRSTTRDGGWAALWDRSRRDATERLEALRELEGYEGGDLGVEDSAALAKVIFQGPTSEVRRLAQAIANEYFSEGPNVARALLDGFERPRRDRAMSEFIQGLSGRLLPSVRDDTWTIEARLQLARHAFKLLESSMHDIDRLASEYSQALEARVRLRASDSVNTDETTSSHVSKLVDAAFIRLENQLQKEPIPATLRELSRRRAVRSGQAIREPQKLVAQLFSLMDLMCFETASLRPDLRAELVDRHAAVTTAMVEAANVLDQILILQAEIARLLIDRLESDGGAS